MDKTERTEGKQNQYECVNENRELQNKRKESLKEGSTRQNKQEVEIIEQMRAINAERGVGSDKEKTEFAYDKAVILERDTENGRKGHTYVGQRCGQKGIERWMQVSKGDRVGSREERQGGGRRIEGHMANEIGKGKGLRGKGVYEG